nr:DNA helicase Pif1-like protein [Tanacetum cinerariifolium]
EMEYLLEKFRHHHHHYHCVDEMTCLDDERMKKRWNDVPRHDHFEVIEFVLEVSQTPGISPSITQFYKPIENQWIHEDRVVDQIYYTSDHIDRCFSNIRLGYLYEINESIVPYFIQDFYSQVTLQRDDSEVILISFMIQNEFITLYLASTIQSNS